MRARKAEETKIELAEPVKWVEKLVDGQWVRVKAGEG